jgi:hypothetical protein
MQEPLDNPRKDARGVSARLASDPGRTGKLDVIAYGTPTGTSSPNACRLAPRGVEKSTLVQLHLREHELAESSRPL